VQSDVTCSIHWGSKKCIQCFGRGTLWKDGLLQTKTVYV